MHIRALNLSKGFGPRTLFENLTFTFETDEHIGLIGPNGSGKSTLMRILAGLEDLDSGSIEGSQNQSVAYLPQEDTFEAEKSLEQLLLDALAGSLLPEHERLTNARRMLSKVGFVDHEQRPDTLSGGWRKRLAIARALVVAPDLLLLDEPSNHLDIAGILWLEKLLQETNTGFLMVSHDRYLLESVTDRMIEINPKYPEGYLSYPGSYSDFLEQREAWFATQEKREQTLANQVRQEVEWLRRGPQGRRTKAKGRIQSAHRKIGELSDLRGRGAGNTRLGADFAATGRKTQDLIVAKGLTKAFDNKTLFTDLEFTLSPGMCLGIVGNNGTGKTTLVRTLVGDLAPDRGTVKHAQSLKTAWFDQRREQLNRTESLRRALAPNGDMLQIGERKVHVVSWAQDFLFRADQLDTPVGDLSGGEQARVLMATLMRQPVDLLFFDEPTNDLDIDSIEVLEEKLVAFPGAVVLITHDRAMIDRVCTEIVGLHEGGGSKVYAALEQWESAEERLRQETQSTPPKKEKLPKPTGFDKEEKREWGRLNSKIPKLEAALAKLQAKQSDPEILNDHERMNTLFTEIAEAQAALDEAFTRWMELEEKLGG